MSTAVQSHFAVRPTPGLLLRRVSKSAEGRAMAFGLILVPAVVVGLAGTLAGIVVGGLLLIAAVGILARTRLEVTSGQLVIHNLLRTRRLSGAEVANIAVQPVNYQQYGATVSQAYRLVVVTTEIDGKTGTPIVLPSFATERKTREAVERMLQHVAITLRG